MVRGSGDAITLGVSSSRSADRGRSWQKQYFSPYFFSFVTMRWRYEVTPRQNSLALPHF